MGRYYASDALLNWASGSMVADFSAINGIGLSTLAGGSGLADTWVEPVHFGQVGDAFVAPTGRFTAGASNNVGSGYWENDVNGGITGYLTKNKGTSVNLFVNWEEHGKKSGTNVTSGQAITWALAAYGVTRCASTAR